MSETTQDNQHFSEEFEEVLTIIQEMGEKEEISDNTQEKDSSFWSLVEKLGKGNEPLTQERKQEVLRTLKTLITRNPKNQEFAKKIADVLGLLKEDEEKTGILKHLKTEPERV